MLHPVELGFGAGGDALEEVFGALDEDALLGFGGLFEEGVEDVGRGELVVVAGDEELGLGAGAEEAVGVVAAGGADGRPRPTRPATRGSPQVARRPTLEPKEKPAKRMGRAKTVCM